MMKKLGLIVAIVSMIVASCQEKHSTKIVVENLAETTKSWNGDLLLNYGEGQPKITVLKITIPPKTKLKWHKHLVINSGILLKGALKVVDENEDVLYLKEGDVIVELVNKYHYGINESDLPAEIVVFYAGTEGVPITVLKDTLGTRDH
jgi:quercetin dioxygenase-like cupin family protein